MGVTCLYFDRIESLSICVTSVNAAPTRMIMLMSHSFLMRHLKVHCFKKVLQITSSTLQEKYVEIMYTHTSVI